MSYELSDLYGDLDEEPTQPTAAPPFGTTPAAPAARTAPFFDEEVPTRVLPADLSAVLRMVSAELPESDDPPALPPGIIVR